MQVTCGRDCNDEEIGIWARIGRWGVERARIGIFVQLVVRP